MPPKYIQYCTGYYIFDNVCMYVLMYDYIYVFFICRVWLYIYRHKHTGTGIKSFLASQVWFQAVAGDNNYQPASHANHSATETSLCMYVSVCICLSIYLSVCLSTSLSLSLYLSIYLFIYLPIYL